MERPTHLITEILEGFSKIWMWVAVLMIGLIGKIGEMLQDGKKRTWLQILGNIMVTLTIGVLSIFFFAWRFPMPGGGINIQSAIGVVVTTMLSDKIALLLTNLNVGPLFEYFTNKDKDDKEVGERRDREDAS